MNIHTLREGDVQSRRGRAISYPHRRGLFKRAFSFLFSPAVAASLALVGYYAFAGLTNKLLPEGSLGGILIRAATTFVIIVAFLRFADRRNGVGMKFLFPLLVFATAYTLRLVHNFYVDTIYIYIPFDANQVFMIFLASGIGPAIAIARMQGAIRDDQFKTALTFLCLLFLVGLALNRGELSASSLGGSSGRLILEKINPIPMANTAFAFVIFYALIFMRSRRNLIEAVVLVPILMIVVLYAGSRGAFASGIAAILLYVLFLKGTRRIWAMVGLSAAAVAAFAFLGRQHFEFMISRFESMIGLGAGRIDGSTQIHLVQWETAFEQFLNDPLVGRYIIETSFNFYPHNIYLESLASVGLLGSIFFLIHIMLASRAAVGIIRQPGFGMAAVFAAVLFFRSSISYFATSSVWAATDYWIASSLVIAIWYGAPRILNQPWK